MMRRYFSIWALLAALALLPAGCDSNDDGPTDAERFVGTWAATGVRDSAGDQSAEFAALVNSLAAVLQAGDENPAFTLTVDYKDDSGQEDRVFSGTYAVDDGPRTLTFMITGSASVPFNYAFENDSQATLSARADIVNNLFDPTTPYEGTVTVNIQKQ